MSYTAETLESVLHELEMLGTAQNRKVYGRHGVGSNQFGVSFADLKRIARRIQTDQHLSEALWSTGNHDARILATMIADPPQMTSRLLDIWAEDLDNYVVTDAFSGLCGKTSLARRKLELWCAVSDEWHGQAGWNLVAILAMSADRLSDEECEKLLSAIERTIHTRLNRVRHAMNGALIAIGLRNGRMQSLAIDAAKKIGKVEVDHGETNCKTPDAVQYIKKASEHYRARGAKKKARTKVKAVSNGRTASATKRPAAVKKKSPAKPAAAKTKTAAARRKEAGKRAAAKPAARTHAPSARKSRAR